MRKRAQDRPAPERDQVLNSILDQEVLVTSVEIDMDHQGRFRRYPLTKVTLSDGRTFNASGRGLAEPLSYLEAADFPIRLTFRRVASDFDPSATYIIAE